MHPSEDLNTHTLKTFARSPTTDAAAAPASRECRGHCAVCLAAELCTRARLKVGGLSATLHTQGVFRASPLLAPHRTLCVTYPIEKDMETGVAPKTVSPDNLIAY